MKSLAAAISILLVFVHSSYSRVGERYNDFKTRVGEKSGREVRLPSNLFYASFEVNGIRINLAGKDGIIYSEVYEPVTEQRAAEIIAKQPGKFQYFKETKTWRNVVNKISGAWKKSNADDGILTIVHDAGKDMEKQALDEAEEIRRNTEKKTKAIDKF